MNGGTGNKTIGDAQQEQELMARFIDMKLVRLTSEEKLDKSDQMNVLSLMKQRIEKCLWVKTGFESQVKVLPFMETWARLQEVRYMPWG